jgi:NAD(P)-dependent dehydrogenase (short-subunit alcohol dehydrogenase family)
MNIIVGGTHGLGENIASQLREHGDEAFIVGRSYDEAKHGAGHKVDLASETGVTQLVERIQKFGAAAAGLNFYWVSGYGYNGNFADQSTPERMAAVNFGNVLPAAQAAFRSMLDSKALSHFVVVSSTTGLKARKDEAVYAGTQTCPSWVHTKPRTRE